MNFEISVTYFFILQKIARFYCYGIWYLFIDNVTDKREKCVMYTTGRSIKFSVDELGFHLLSFLFVEV